MYDPSLTIDNQQNFTTNLVVVNGEYIYKLTIPKGNNYTYYINLNLLKK